MHYRFLVFSLLIHVVLLVGIAGDFFRVFFKKNQVVIKKAVRVDMVGLPEIHSITSSKIPLNKKKTRPAVLSSKKKIVKKKKTVKKRKKNQKKKLNQQKLKSQQKQALAVLKASESIEKIKQDLSSVKHTGSQISKGQDREGILSSTDHFEMLKYFTWIRSHINLYWNLPLELADKNLRAKIYVVMDKKGVILNKRILQSSGNEDFDVRVLETLQKASPFPVPPTKKIQDQLSAGIVFNFPE